MTKRVKHIIGVMIAVLLSFAVVGSVFSQTEPAEKSKGFCVVYEGKKILTDVQSFELVANDAAFAVQTVEGEPVKDYSVSVRAAYPREDFNVVFNDVDVYSWEKDFSAVNYEFGSAEIVKSENNFTVKNTRLTTILAEEFPGIDIRYENLDSPKNVLQIDVTVSGETLSIMYFVDVAVSGIELSQGVIIC